MTAPRQASRWSSMIAMYELHFEPILARWATDAVDAVHTKLHDTLSLQDASPVTVVDVGCGLGALTLAFAERFVTGLDDNGVLSRPVRITSSDISPDMLARLLQRVEAPRYQHLAKQIETKVMDGQTLELFGDGSVDVVMSSFGISIFPDQDKSWMSANRVLKDGGIIVATAWDVESDNVKWFDALATAAHQVATSGDGAEGPALEAPSSKLAYDPAKLVARLESVGFRDVVVYKTSHSSIIPSGEELVDAMLQNPGVAAHLTVLGEDRFREVMLECINEGYDSVFTGDFVSAEEKRSLGRPVVVSNSGFVVVATK